jgi:hypothetical protein
MLVSIYFTILARPPRTFRTYCCRFMALGDWVYLTDSVRETGTCIELTVGWMQ